MIVIILSNIGVLNTVLHHNSKGMFDIASPSALQQYCSTPGVGAGETYGSPVAQSILARERKELWCIVGWKHATMHRTSDRAARAVL